MMDRRLVLVSVFLAFIAAAGCLEPNMRLESFKLSNMSLNSSDSISNYSAGKCMALICGIEGAWFGPSSYKGKSCSMQVITAQQFAQNSSDLYNGRIPMYLLGAGSTSTWFNFGNMMCNNSMRLSVKWLVGKADEPYADASKDASECYLTKEVFPLYMLYSGGENVDPSRAAEIATELNGAGPLMLVSEMDLGDPDLVPAVQQQLVGMKAACPACQIGLGVKLNGSSEYEITSAVFDDPAAFAATDFVAYGLNTHYFKECNSAKMVYYAQNFSHWLMAGYTKRSIISYALFDRAEGLDGLCSWNDATVGQALTDLHANSYNLLRSGVMGYAAYSVYGKGPLNCRDCSLLKMGLLGCSDISLAANEPFYTDFFGNCQAYYNGFGSQEKRTLPVMPMVFTNGSDDCSYTTNLNLFSFIKFSTTGDKPDVENPITMDSHKSFWCAECTSPLLPPVVSASGAPAEVCGGFIPTIELAADAVNMDPVLLRAVAWQESGMKKCAVSHVSVSNIKCNPLNLMDEQVQDPDGCCTEHTTKQWFLYGTKCYTPEEAADKAPNVTQGARCKPCAYGLTQNIEYPSNLYAGHSDLLTPQIIEAMNFCGTGDGVNTDLFNPFRPYDDSCMYAYKYVHFNLPAAKALVSANEGKLHVASVDPANVSLKKWMAAFFALDNMYGHQSVPGCHASSDTQQDWIDQFSKQYYSNDCTTCLNDENRTACCGNRNFFDFVKNCEHNGSFSYAYDVLSKYLAVSSQCGISACPAKPSIIISNTNIGDQCSPGGPGMLVNTTDCCLYAKNGGVFDALNFCSVAPAECKAMACAGPS
jgi:hypothetical protein